MSGVYTSTTFNVKSTMDRTLICIEAKIIYEKCSWNAVTFPNWKNAPSATYQPQGEHQATVANWINIRTPELIKVLDEKSIKLMQTAMSPKKDSLSEGLYEREKLYTFLRSLPPVENDPLPPFQFFPDFNRYDTPENMFPENGSPVARFLYAFASFDKPTKVSKLRSLLTSDIKNCTYSGSGSSSKSESHCSLVMTKEYLEKTKAVWVGESQEVLSVSSAYSESEPFLITVRWFKVYKKEESTEQRKKWYDFALTMIFGEAQNIDFANLDQDTLIQFLNTLLWFIQADYPNMIGANELALIPSYVSKFSTGLNEMLSTALLSGDTARLEDLFNLQLFESIELGSLKEEVCLQSESLCSVLRRREQWMLKKEILATFQNGAVLNKTIVEKVGEYVEVYTNSADNSSLWNTWNTLMAFQTTDSQSLTESLYEKGNSVLVLNSPYVLWLLSLIRYRQELGNLKELFDVVDEIVTYAHLKELEPLVLRRLVNETISYLANGNLAGFSDVVLLPICNDPINSQEDWRACGLPNIFSGVRALLSFETSDNSNAISLDGLHDEDLQRALDQIDRNNKHLETIQTIQQSANQLGDRVDQASEEILRNMGQSFESIGSYFQSDADLTVGVFQKQVKLSNETSNGLLVELGEKLEPFTDVLKELNRVMQAAGAGEIIYLIIQLAIAVADLVAEIIANLNPFRHLFGGVDYGKIAELMQKIFEISAEIARVAQDLESLVKIGKDLVEFTTTIQKRFAQLQEMQNQNLEILRKIEGLAEQPEVTEKELEEFVSGFLVAYEAFEVPMTGSNINDLESQSSLMIDTMCNLAEGYGAENVIATGARPHCAEPKKQLPQVFSRFVEVFDELNAQHEKLAEFARAAVNQLSARNIVNFSTQLSNKQITNDPIYALEFTILSQVTSDYKIQEGARNFCQLNSYKYGKDRLPEACDNAYYTLKHTQEMSRWIPPNMHDLSLVARMPTYPSGNLVPFLNLTDLVNGEELYFTLPQNISWLKEYNWIRNSESDDIMYFVQSMEIVLPLVRKDEGGDAPLLDVTVIAESGKSQRHLGVEKSYSIVSHDLSYHYSLGNTLCPSSRFNPYHLAASCTSNDVSSQICTVKEGISDIDTLLPSLFTNWKVSAQFDQIGRYEIAQPAEGQKMDILINLELKQFSRVRRRRDVPSDSCCGTNEFKTIVNHQPVCSPCPAGKRNGLNGYICLA